MNEMRRLMMLCEADDFSMAPIGTILSVASEDRFGSTLFTMKMSNGDWHALVSQGPKRGIEQFTLGDGPISDQLLRDAAAANRVGGVVQGLHLGDPIATGVQVLALPIGSLVRNPQTGSEYTRQADGMVGDGKTIPEWAFNADNAVWAK